MTTQHAQTIRAWCLSLAMLASTLFGANGLMAFVGSTRDLAIIAEFGVEENLGITLSTPPEDPQQPAGLGAASNLLLNIIFQEVPVLAPKTLWENIARHKNMFDDFAKLDTTQLKKKYGKYPRFQSANAIIDFQQQATYLTKLYHRAMHHINTTNTLEECKQMMAKDPLFKTSAAPKSLQQKHYDKWLELSAYLMCSVIPANRYDIRAITSPNNSNAVFYLFLPHTYLERIEQEVLQNPGQYILKQSNFTATELGLGIKISKFPLVEKLFATEKKPDVPDDYPEQLLPALRTLFIEKNEVPAKTQQSWAFYIMGHGLFSQEAKDLMKKKHCDLKQLYEELDTADSEKKGKVTKKIRSCNMLMADLRQGNKVIGLPIDAFVQLLKFFDKDIKTSLLFYSSCSAGGQQWLDSFKDNGKPLRLSYAIMADTLAEAPSLNGAPVLRLQCLHGHKSYCSLDNLINWKKRSLAIDAIYDFQAFFAMARCPRPHPTLISHMIHCLCPASPKREVDKSSVSRWVGNWFQRSSHIIDQHADSDKHLERSEVNNITSIRLPGDRAFKVVDSKDSFIALTEPYKHVIDSHKKDLVLLGGSNFDEISITKKVDPTPFPFIVSFIPGSAHHTIDLLNAPAFSFLEILDQFFCCEKMGTPKMIHIKTLNCLNDIKTRNAKSATFKNCYIYMSVPFQAKDEDDKYNGVIFDLDGKHYHLSWPYLDNTPEEPNFQLMDDHNYKKLTEHLLKTFQDANQLESFSQQNNALITLEEITDFFEDE